MRVVARLLLLVLLASGGTDGASAGQVTYTPDPAPALGAFNREVGTYIALRATLATEIPPLRPDSTAVEITSSSDALARAIQRARPKPPRGVFFDSAAVALITGRLQQLFATRGDVLDGIEDEPPTVRNPGVYLRFPAASMLATMPPSVLAVLPPLPAELEYRIVGTHLVLRDIHAALVLDVIPNAVPRR